MDVYPRRLGRDEIVPLQTGDYSDRMRTKRDGLAVSDAATNVATVDSKRTLEMHIHQMIANFDKDLFRQVEAYNMVVAQQLGERMPALLEKRVICKELGTGGDITGLGCSCGKHDLRREHSCWNCLRHEQRWRGDDPAAA